MKKSDISVLVVDDDRAIGQTLCEAITRSGYQAVFAARGDEALNLVRIRHIHAAVVDCMLPGLNGISLVEELRKTRFDNGIVILMSGVFKDKSFEQEAIAKTGAVEYLQKPFGPLDLMSVLKPILDGLIGNQEWSLQTILSKKLTSTRDRVKVVEHLEEIKGVEMAFVLSILMDAKASGYLNLVAENDGLFGVTLRNGQIMSVDSEDADKASIRFLIDTGYLINEDLSEYEAKLAEERRNGRAPLEKLVNLGYISPHAAEQAKHDQILSDVKRILRFKELNINFVPEAPGPSRMEGLDLVAIFSELNDALEALLTREYLRDFFKPYMNGNLKNVGSLAPDHPIFSLPIIKRSEDYLKNLNRDLASIIKTNPGQELEILRAVYLLIIFRQLLFIDLGVSKGFAEEVKRRQKMLEALETKDPAEVFQYFGSSSDPKESELRDIYKEFIKSNHPDNVSPDAPAELRKITERIFSIVSSAHDVLTVPEKKKLHLAEKQSRLAERAMRAEGIAADGLEMIRRGQYARAVEKLTESIQMADRSETQCLLIWATLKAKTGKVSRAELADMQKKLDEIVSAERSNPHYHMALGLLRQANGDATAVNAFEKALALRNNFVEARREINAFASANKKASASDLLTGDITQLVSQIFKKKAK